MTGTILLLSVSCALSTVCVGLCMTIWKRQDEQIEFNNESNRWAASIQDRIVKLERRYAQLHGEVASIRKPKVKQELEEGE